jgi:UDP-N-acetylmuramoyl-tripeptide--D-alanyl-D-alanine ligase
LTLAFTVALWLLAVWRAYVVIGSSLLLVLVTGLWIVSIPFFVLFGNYILSVYFEWIKSKIRTSAANKVTEVENLKIVNVAGSYGKTTTKNFIYQLIQPVYRTQMIPGNINTPAGIGDWINKNLQSSTEVLVAELDTFYPGEIAKSSRIIPADIAVLTNVGDQHLERFRNKKQLALALSEVFTVPKKKVELITTKQTSKLLRIPKKVSLSVPSSEIRYQTRKITIHDLSASNKVNLMFALKVCEFLAVPYRFIANTITKLELPERRQKPTFMYGYEALDDSYNISFTTAKAGVEAAKRLATKKNKKLLVLTAGIPELSSDNFANNRKLGAILSNEADHVVVLGSMFASDIESGGKVGKITRVSDLKHFLSEVATNFSKDEWFLLHQPELNDLYY